WLDLREQRRAVVPQELVVDLALGRLHLADDGLLGLLGQLGEHLLLGAAEDERPQRPAELRRGLGGLQAARRAGEVDRRRVRVAGATPGVLRSTGSGAVRAGASGYCRGLSPRHPM